MAVNLSVTTVVFSLATLAAVPAALAQGNAPVYPGLIQLPSGFGPEGIGIGNGSTFYVGAGVGTPVAMRGQILTGDLRTGTFSQLVSPTGLHALGMKFDSRSNLLFVAGGPTGTGRVYDASSGAQVAFYQFKTPVLPGPSITFVNDVIVTKNAAYFTDSARAFLYRVALGWQSEPSVHFEEIPLLPAVIFGPLPAAAGACGPSSRANGIAADPSGKHLIIGNSSHGKLFRMDTATHTLEPVDLAGGLLCGADGLVLDGKTLYVVSKILPTDPFTNRVAVVEMSADYLAGTITRSITEPFASNPATRVPATIAEFGRSLYAVTGGFAPPAPDYVVRLRK